MSHPIEALEKLLASISSLISSKPVLVIDDDLKPDCWISIIIPAYNEEETIKETITKILVPKDPMVEIILADGGSTDNTKKIAKDLGAQVFDAPPGRASCQNFGASKSIGDILLFLHADTYLPKNWNFLVRNSLKDNKVLVSAFSFKLCKQTSLGWLLEWGTNVRSKYRQHPYGDQALHMRKSVFKKLGEFPKESFMEDFIFVNKARNLGTVATLPTPAHTSGRRWEKRGTIYNTMFNQLVIIGYMVGIPTQELKTWYYDQKNQ